MKSLAKDSLSRTGLIAIVAMLFFGGSTALGIEDATLQNNSTTLYGRILNYDSVLNSAIENSYDIKTSSINIDISRQRLYGAKREYMPALDIRLNSEYNKGLDNNSQGIRTVNGSIINGTTRYQDSVSINLQHTILDYGIKKYQVKIAETDISQKEIIQMQTLRDLKLQVLELYTKVLTTYLELNNLEVEQGLQKEILSMQERLYKAGLCSKIEVKQTEADLNSIQIKIENTNLNLAELLAELTFYTNLEYDTKLEDVGELIQISQVIPEEIDYTKSSEYISYKHEIEKKRSELTILKRELLPQIAAYSGYSIYGTDKDSFNSALSDMRQSNITVGLSTSLGITQQFKQTPKIRELELQIQSLEFEQTHKTSNFTKEINKSLRLVQIYESEKQKNNELKTVLEAKLQMLEKLDKSRLINKTDLLAQQIQNNRQNTEFKIIEQKANAQNIKLRYLLEDVNALGAIGIDNI